MSSRPTAEFFLLIAAAVGEAVVLYFVDDPITRLGAGLFLLAPIVWSAARVGVMDLISQTPAERVQKRRFVLLRSQVQQLLDEIRRLNWMAVDAERGFRNREAASREMDAIEGRLKALIEQIRSTAGQMSAEEEAAPQSEGQAVRGE